MQNYFLRLFILLITFLSFSIAQDVEQKVINLPGINDVLVEIVWEPVWDRSMMSEDAQLKLGMF